MIRGHRSPSLTAKFTVGSVLPTMGLNSLLESFLDICWLQEQAQILGRELIENLMKYGLTLIDIPKGDSMGSPTKGPDFEKKLH